MKDGGGQIDPTPQEKKPTLTTLKKPNLTRVNVQNVINFDKVNF